MPKPSALALASATLAAGVMVLVAVRHPQAESTLPSPLDPSYASTIQPIFEHRCMPCHACYDSSCQLNLQSFEGLDRGANQTVVYFPERAVAAKPTRMFQDAQTTADWRSQFDFFPVLDRDPGADLPSSILWRFITQRVAHPEGSGFDVDKTTTCPRKLADVDTEFRNRPERGMPFGFPPLTGAQTDAIAAWLRSGAGGPVVNDAPTPAQAKEIGRWESFFDDRSDPRSPLVSAYIFEHLFYAHLHFDAAPDAWFRLVRSRTPPGTPIDELATRRPYDDPGSAQRYQGSNVATPFYYRLRRIRETLVEKTHVPYRLSDKKLAHLKKLFFEPAWSVPADPAPSGSPGLSPYDRKLAANPFLAFAPIPARARYQFMLDDARYMVQTFINGPVCRGQAALDVIDEQFLIFFLAPDSDPAITDPAYLLRVAKDLALPAEDGDKIEALSLGYDVRERAYLRAQAPSEKARTVADIWHGDGNNPDAVLTVFRHFDNAYVVHGAVGGMPKTAWVMDYPIFERIYYDLVAGFDVYGNVAHQLGTRIYMNLLRIESEGQLLRFLPVGERARVHGQWYRSRVAKALADIHATSFAGPETAVAYADPAHAKEELLTRLLTLELPAAVAGPREPIGWPDVQPSTDPVRARVELALRGLVNRPAPYVAAFPDTLLLRVKAGADRDFVYTIARNRAHTSVEFIFAEGVELQPAEDTLQIVSGIVTSRPSFFLTVDAASEGELAAFVQAWQALRVEDDSWRAFAARYGARRSDPAFWATFDFFADAFPKLDPLGAAVLDLSRYSDD
jgi:hypothetical protein